MIKILIATIFMVSLLGAGQAFADSLSNMLGVSRIVSQNGIEHSEPATSAKPGDILEYTATYRNSGDKDVRKLEVTLPIPEGTEYLPGETHPAGAWASVDGKNFAPEPLRHRVSKPNGSQIDEAVALQDYRFLRWPPANLAAGATLECRARVKIATRVAESKTR